MSTAFRCTLFDDLNSFNLQNLITGNLKLLIKYYLQHILFF